MPKKNKLQKKKKQHEEEIIIGYNSKGKKDKPPRNKRKAKNKRRRIKKILILFLKSILILAVFVGIGAFLLVSPIFNITKIEVENASKISENTYIVLSDIHIGENIFRINKFKIAEAIKSESYVEDLKISREFPGTVHLKITERTPRYMVEKNGGMYMYIDKNGYYLETSTEKLEIPVLKGILTDENSLNLGERIIKDDLVKFNDLMKITDEMKNKNLEMKDVVIDISNQENYMLEFIAFNKKVILGDISNLNTKIAWIKYFIEEKSNEKGIIHLSDIENVYFTPEA